MTTIDRNLLAGVSGGFARGQSPDQLRQRKRELCGTPTPARAREQYNWMLQHMVPDTSEAPGIKQRAVKHVAQTCGWPFPAHPSNAR